MDVYVDADVPLYVCCIYGVDTFPAIDSLGVPECAAYDPRFVEGLIDEWVERWVEPLNPDRVIYCYSYGDNFRKELTSEYKAKRQEKPAAFAEMQQRMLARDDALYIEGLEADDVIGLYCTHDPEAVAVSVDKDFFTVPMKFYRPGFSEFPYETSQQEADLFWMRQTMTGDSVDGIKGIPKVGPVKAEKILPESRPLVQLWEEVKRSYREKGLTDADALLNARLTRILRRGDYDFERKRIILWEGC